MARAEPRQRGLLAVGAVLSAFAALSGMIGLAANALGSDARVLHELGRTMSGAEPIVSIGTALLATLALGALAPPLGSKVMARASLVTIGVAISAALSLGFKLVRLLDSGARSLPAAWTSWLVEVTRPALVALLALSLLRAMARTPAADARPEGPYRAAGEGAPAATRKEVLDAAGIASLGSVARGLGSYRTTFLVRMGASVVTTFLVFLVGITVHTDSGMLLMAAMPFASVATAVLLALALFKLLALPRGVRARGVTIGAIIALALASLIDAGTLLVAFSALYGPSSYRAKREFMESMVIAWPLVAMAGGVSLLFVASALRRLGERLGDDRVVGRARWVQGLAIGAGAAQLGALLAAMVMNGSRHDSSSAAGGVVVLGLVLAALGATIAVVIQHVRLLGAARSAVLAAVAEAPHAG
jgi:hypothetical protein